MLDVSATQAYLIRHWVSRVPLEGSCREQKERWKGGYTCWCSWSVSCPQCQALWCGDKSRVMCPLLLGAHLGSTQQHQLPWPRLQKFHFFL